MGQSTKTSSGTRGTLEGLAPIETHTPRSSETALPAESLLDTMSALSRARSREAVSQVATASARTLLRAEGATFVLRDGDQCLYLNEDAITPLWKGQRLPFDACISGWAMRHVEQAAIADIYADSRIAYTAYRASFVRSLVMTPVCRELPVAAIGVYWADFHVASERELAVLNALAQMTAVALENAELFEEQTRMIEDRNEQLSYASKELETMARTVSHDLRSPLNAIIGFAELLQEEERPVALVRSFAQEIAGAGRRMNHLIGALLDFARNARSEPQKCQTELSVIASRVIDQLRANGQYPAVELLIAPRLHVHADPALMEVALTHLFDNALKYSVRADPPRIRFGKIDHQAGPTTFFVRDNGVGFDQAHSARLFAPFQRLHSEQEFAGNGVGLSTVARIIKRHGGRIWAEGRPGEGATVFFTLQPRE